MDKIRVINHIVARVIFLEVAGEMNQIKVAAETGYRYECKGTEALNKLINDYSKYKTIDLNKKGLPNTEHLKSFEKGGKEQITQKLMEKRIKIMSRIILITLFTFVFFGCNAQVKKENNNEKMDLSFIRNGKIKHSIVMLSCDTCAPVSNIGYRVVVNLSNKEVEKIKKISTEKWLQLLKDNKSDYLANLILYGLYNKNAVRFLQIDNVEKWRKYMRKEDIEYWELHLQK